MNDVIKEVLVEMRSQIKRLQQLFHDERFYLNFSHGKNDINSNFNRNAQTQLVYLVPIYRGLNALAQQTVTGGKEGQKLYRSKFERLKIDMYADISRFKREFDQESKSIKLLKPIVGESPEKWTVTTIFDMIQESIEAESTAQRNRVAKIENANQTRKALLDSFTADQRQLLRQALIAAQSTGSPFIVFNAYDLS